MSCSLSQFGDLFPQQRKSWSLFAFEAMTSLMVVDRDLRVLLYLMISPLN